MIYPTKGRGIYVTEQLHKSFNFDINGQGLYIWAPIKNGQEPTNYDSIEYKIGQYGTNASEGTNPVVTIDGYLGTHNTQALILYAIDLTEYIKSQSKYKSAYDIEHVLHSDIVLKDGAYRNDKSLDNIRSTEFFTNTNLETIIKRINTILYGVSRIHSYPMRDEQKIAHDKIIDAFKFGYDEFLLAAKMRFGKNFTILNVAKSLGWKNVLVLTYKPYVFDSLKDDINDHVAFENFQIIDYKTNREIKHISDTKCNIFLSSAQLMMNKSENGNLDDVVKKFQKNLTNLLSRNIKFDAIIADEYHYGGNTISFRDLLNTIPHEKTIYVSGTAYKDIARGRFDDDQIYSWTYIDEQREKEQELKIGHGSHISMPTMKTHIIRISNDAKLSQQYYTDAEGLTLDKIIAYDDSKHDLLYKGSAELLLKSIAGRYGHNSLSPYRLVSGLDHTLWVLPKNTKGIIALANLMKTMSEYSGYEIIIATGNEITQIDDVKNLINRAKSNNKGTITMTCQRFKEGVTIPEWNGIFMLDSGQSLEEYTQAIFRAQSPNVSIYKQYCHVFDFNPERCLSMVYDICERTNKDINSNISDNIREYLNYSPILDYMDNSWSEISISNVINNFREHGKFSERFYSIPLNPKYIDDKIINSVAKVKSEQKSDSVDVNSNDTNKGKTKTNTKSNDGMMSEYSADKDIDKKSLMETIKKIRTAISKLPEFMFITPNNEKTVDDIMNTTEDELFRDITGVSLEDFKYWFAKEFVDIIDINRTILHFADALEYFESNITSESYDEFVRKNLNMKGVYCKTPLVIIKRMFELVNVDFTNPHKALIDPCMGTGSFLLYAKEQYMIGLKSYIEDDIEREKYILENILFGYDIDRIKVNMANILLNKNNYKCNLRLGDALRLHKEYKDMKFDYMISNPPYNNNLDLKIIKAVYPLVSDDGRMCFIHPAGWLYDKKGNKLYNSTKELLKDDYSANSVITNGEANKLFGIGLFNDIIINVFDKNTACPIDIMKLDIHGSGPIYLAIKPKILSYCKIDSLHTKFNKERPYKVGVSWGRGNPGTIDVFTLLQRKLEHHIGENLIYKEYIWSFGTEVESFNFLNYLKLKLVRFTLSILKRNMHFNTGELKAVPYLPTYTHEWTDEMVAQELGLTDEELRWAINWIPDYYPEDAERYAKYFDPKQTERQFVKDEKKRIFGGHIV